MEIRLARSMGFCFGVKRAVKTAEQAANSRGRVVSLGPVVHNDQVVDRLGDLGVFVAGSLQDIPTGPVVISAHGVGEAVYQEAGRRGLEIVDATCPIVRQIQRKARELSEAGFLVVIFGDRDHSEVKGVAGWAKGNVAVVGTAAEIATLPKARKIAVLAQSTLATSTFTDLVAQLVAQRIGSTQQLVVHNTLCNSTTSAQAAALELAREVSVILVIGGKTSANTRHLAELCAESGVATHLIERAGDIEAGWLTSGLPVGVTAGASTPEWVIDEVIERIEEIGKSLDTPRGASG